jgi:hypothetical protein
MQKHTTLLSRSLGRSNDMYDRAKFGKGPSYRVETRQFCVALAQGCRPDYEYDLPPTPNVVTKAPIPNNRPYASAAYPGRPQSSRSGQNEVWKSTSIQFVAVADPIDATRLNVIESDEVKVARYSMKVLDTKLMESGKQVLGDVDFLATHDERRNSDLVFRCNQGGKLLMFVCSSSGNVWQSQ